MLNCKNIITINGAFHQGKTILVNLFRNNGNYKVIDITNNYNNITKLKKEIGISNSIKLGSKIRDKDNNFRHIEFKDFVELTKDYINKTNKDLVIVYRSVDIWIDRNEISDHNCYHFFVFRDPRLSYFTYSIESDKYKMSIFEFIKFYKFEFLTYKKRLDKFYLIKNETLYEDVVSYGFSNIVKDKDSIILNRTFTEFDYKNLYNKESQLKNIEEDIKYIEEELKEEMKELGYDYKIDINQIVKEKYEILYRHSRTK